MSGKRRRLQQLDISGPLPFDGDGFGGVIQNELDTSPLPSPPREGEGAGKNSKSILFMSSKTNRIASLLILILAANLALAAKRDRPTPPTRDPHTPGYVEAKELPD